MIPLLADDIERYVHDHTTEEPAYLQELAARTHERMASPQMLTGRVAGRFLKLLVQLMQPRLIVEVGTFTGYSALCMAEGLTGDGRIITCEVDPEAQTLAQQAFDTSPVGRRIDLRMAPAMETIESLTEEVDFSFIDADKAAYPAYYEALLQRTRPGGVLLFDNALWSGRVVQPEDADTKAIASANASIQKDERVECVLLSIRDGMMLVRKKG